MPEPPENGEPLSGIYSLAGLLVVHLTSNEFTDDLRDLDGTDEDHGS